MSSGATIVVVLLWNALVAGFIFGMLRLMGFFDDSGKLPTKDEKMEMLFYVLCDDNPRFKEGKEANR